MGFCGQRLRVAREFRALTQSELAQKVSASSALISLCEAGKNKRPSRDFVEACGAVLGFEPAFFHAPLEDVFQEDECNFRHRRATPERIKAQIRAHGTLIGLVIQTLGSRRLFAPINVPRVAASSCEQIELAAEHCRRHWNLGQDGPVPELRIILEEAGAIVIDHVVKSNKVDTFSRYSAPMAVIFPNEQTLSSSVWNFDIAHELGHIVMHRGIRTGNIETEREADAFASAFLMPAGAFGREFQARPFSWEHVFRLKKRWGASAAAIVKRAYDLNLLGAVEYRATTKRMYRKGWNKQEPRESQPEQSGMFERVLNSLGQKTTLTIDLPIEKLCKQLCFTPDTFYEVIGIAITPAPPSVVAQPEPPKQIPKPPPRPEELGVFGLDSIPPGAEVVWVTSSENVAELARNNYAHPIVVMKEWHRALRDHRVFRDAKVLLLIHPAQSNALYDPEKEASWHLRASLEAAPEVKSRLQCVNANAIPY